MKAISILVVALSGILFCSCSKTVDVHCKSSDAGAFIYFAHFDSTQIRTVTTYKFPKGQQFQQAIDTMISVLHYDTKTSQVRDWNAFLYDDTVIAQEVGVSIGYEYIIQAEPVGRSWKISGITYRDEVHTDRSSSIHSYSCPVDGYTVDSIQYRGNVVFLK